MKALFGILEGQKFLEKSDFFFDTCIFHDATGKESGHYRK